jgi:hypothetical protein
MTRLADELRAKAKEADDGMYGEIAAHAYERAAEMVENDPLRVKLKALAKELETASETGLDVKMEDGTMQKGKRVITCEAIARHLRDLLVET